MVPEEMLLIAKCSENERNRIAAGKLLLEMDKVNQIDERPELGIGGPQVVLCLPTNNRGDDEQAFTHIETDGEVVPKNGKPKVIIDKMFTGGEDVERDLDED